MRWLISARRLLLPHSLRAAMSIFASTGARAVDDRKFPGVVRIFPENRHNENAAGVQQSWQHFVCHKLLSIAIAVLCLLIGGIGKNDLKCFRPGDVPEKIENVLLSNASL